MEEQERYYEKLEKNYKLELSKLQKQIVVTSYLASTYRNHRDVILPSIFPSV